MKAIIFDCDGTLVDTELAHYSAWAMALQKRGFEFTLEEYHGFVGVPSSKTSNALAKKLGKICPDELLRDKYEFFASLVQHEVLPINDTLEFLYKLIDEQSHFKYRLAIASGATREVIIHYLRHLNIEHMFDVILSGQDDLQGYEDPEGINKPKPYIYIEAAKRLGVKPSECVAIEDSYPGVLASSAAGCFTVAVPTPYSQNHDFSSADLVIPSFKNYTVAKFLKEIKRS